MCSEYIALALKENRGLLMQGPRAGVLLAQV